VVIAGPAEAKVPPVLGATLLITYKKEPNQGGEGPSLMVTGSPTPAATTAPSVTPTPTSTPTPTPTVTPAPTATPQPTRTPRPPP
jgi:hypothetical protein